MGIKGMHDFWKWDVRWAAQNFILKPHLEVHNFKRLERPK